MGKKKRKQGKQYVLSSPEMHEYKRELDMLCIVKRKEVADEIRQIRLQGDVSNNPAYQAAKDKQRDIEARINELKTILEKSQISNIKTDFVHDKVMLGSVVKVHNLSFDEYETYTIVDSTKVNSLKNKISNESPLGKALIGAKVEQIISFKTPAGEMKYKILSLEKFLNEYRNHVENTENNTTNNNENPTNITDILPQHFVTRTNVFRCSTKSHELTDIMCRVKVVRRNGSIGAITIPGAYCDTCKRYYILERDYERLKIQGIPLCKIVEYDFWTSNNQSTFLGLNHESLLHMMGYNVNAQENLSTKQRWCILETIIDAKILTVIEIQSHLEWLIRRSKNLDNFASARSKWEYDSKHIAEYDNNRKTIVDAASITKKNNIKKP